MLVAFSSNIEMNEENGELNEEGGWEEERRKVREEEREKIRKEEREKLEEGKKKKKCNALNNEYNIELSL